jgi:protein AroM
MPTIGFATIAESPRDDVVPAMRTYLPIDIQVAERGCLDGLSRDEIAALSPDNGEVGIVARLKAGGSTLLSHSKILPRMQRCVDELINDEGADLVVILCGADWSAIQAERFVVNPGRVFPGVIGGLAHGHRLGIIKPSAGQVESETARYRSQGIDAIVTSANPYAEEERIALARIAGHELLHAGCDLIWMTCIGMDVAMRDAVAEVTGKPVVLAQAILARVVAELLPVQQPALTR